MFPPPAGGPDDGDREGRGGAYRGKRDGTAPTGVRPGRRRLLAALATAAVLLTAGTVATIHGLALPPPCERPVRP
jgi:hypothetical protein